MHANAGEVSPGYSSPWAGPGVPLHAIKWMLMQHSPLVIKPMLDPAMWRWSASMPRNCTTRRYRVNKSRMVRLVEYSRDCLKALRAETGIRYDERSRGLLQLLRTQKQVDGLGHGTLGWTMAGGTGRVMADLVSGRKPEIEVDDLAVDRYA